MPTTTTLTLNGLADDEPNLAPRDQLFAVLQGDRPFDGASRHLLDGVDEVVLGRGDARKASRLTEGRRQILDLRFPDSRMSSTHARVVRADGGYVFEDAQSKNGSR